MIRITLPGDPIRRVSPTFSKIRTFDSQKHLLHAAKFQVLDQTRKFNIPFPSCIPIEIELKFFFSIPKGKENLFHWDLLDMVDTPDFDNLAKFYCDVVKKIVFEDDRQINIATITKEYCDTPRTEIYIMPKAPKCSDQVKEVLSMISPDYFCELASAMAVMADWQHANGLDKHGDHDEVAYLILEFAERYADSLKKINKKFPGLAKVLKEKMENK